MLILGSMAASMAAGAMLYSASWRQAHPSGEAGTSTPQQAGRHDRRMRALPFPAACRTLCRSRRRALRLAGQRAEAYHWSWCRDVELHLPSEFAVLMMTKTDLGCCHWRRLSYVAARMRRRGDRMKMHRLLPLIAAAVLFAPPLAGADRQALPRRLPEPGRLRAGHEPRQADGRNRTPARAERLDPRRQS